MTLGRRDVCIIYVILIIIIFNNDITTIERTFLRTRNSRGSRTSFQLYWASFADSKFLVNAETKKLSIISHKVVSFGP